MAVQPPGHHRSAADSSGAAWSTIPDTITSEVILRFTPDSALVLRLVSRELNRLSDDFLRMNATEIVTQCNAADSPLHSLIYRSFVNCNMRLWLSPVQCAIEFLLSIPEEIRELGAYPGECPDGILYPAKVAWFNRTIEDLNFVRVWNHVQQRIVDANLQVEGVPGRTALVGDGYSTSAQNRRTWMHAHLNVLQGLTELNLRYLALSGVPVEVGLLTGLQRLRVENNCLRVLLPGLFNRLSGLHTLALENNQLQSLAPGIFHGLGRLEVLSLNGNQLGALSPDLFAGLGNLRRLSLHENPLGALSPVQFEGLSRLEYLTLYATGLRALPQGLFDGLTRLQIIALSSNRIHTLFPDQFHGLTQLLHLELDHNALSALAPDQFHGLTSLRMLRLEGNQLSALSPRLLDGLSSLDFFSVLDNPQLLISWVGLNGNRVPEFNAFFNYHRRSQFAEFYQLAAGAPSVEVLREAFGGLPQTLRNALTAGVREEMGLPGSLMEEHALDDMQLFNRVLKRFVREEFDRLSEDQRNGVYWHVYRMAREESGAGDVDFNDPQWGEHHAFDNILRLIDAMHVVLPFGR